MATYGVMMLGTTFDNSKSSVFRISLASDTVALLGMPLDLPVIFKTGYGMLRTSPLDRNIAVVAGVELGTTRVFVYRVNFNDNSITALGNYQGSANGSFCSDIVWELAADTVWIAMGTTNAIGIGTGQTMTEDAVQGVYKSIGGAALTLQGKGHAYPFTETNINKNNTITSLAIREDEPRRIYCYHMIANNPGIANTMISYSDDEGVTWASPNYPGSRAFQYWCLTALEWHPEWMTPGLFGIYDKSGTGAYSLGLQTETALYSPNAVVTANPLDFNLQSGLEGGIFYDNSGNGVAMDTSNTGFKVYTTNNFGETWALDFDNGLAGVPTWRSWAKSPTSDDFVETAYLSGTSPSWLLWKTGASGVYHTGRIADYFTFGIDFGPNGIIPLTTAYRQLLTWRDARGFIGHTTFYVGAEDLATAREEALEIQTALIAATNAALNASIGPWTEPPTEATYGAAEPFQNIEDTIILTFTTALGTFGGIGLPAPLRRLFLDDLITGYREDSILTALYTACLSNGLCTEAGTPFTDFAGAHYTRSKLRRQHSIYTLNPHLTGPGL